MMIVIIRLLVYLATLLGSATMPSPLKFIPANHPFIQYSGRWDVSDTLHRKHSWPGAYLRASFSGTSIGIRMKDNLNYYNVYIDGTLYKIFRGTSPDEAEYTLAEGLDSSAHALLLSKRNFMFDAVFSVSGLLIEEGASLLPPPPRPERRIEFVGDSFTAAEGNEATMQDVAWEDRFPLTNIDRGFAPIVARHFDAEYHTTCRSGSGMVCNWEGNPEITIPKIFNRTLMEAPEPKWDFRQWKPDLIVICLGLNDHSGLRDSNGNISEEKSSFFRRGYTEFISRLRTLYPGVRLLAVAAHPEWVRTNVHQVVQEELLHGMKDVAYTTFDEVPGGYVANNHPTVATHEKIAEQIIAAIEREKIFPVMK
ncbi:MAG: GDSL-type esterase/lipase family protein [bacterium]